MTKMVRRRIRGDIIETYKILNGGYNIPRFRLDDKKLVLVIEW